MRNLRNEPDGNTGCPGRFPAFSGRKPVGGRTGRHPDVPVMAGWMLLSGFLAVCLMVLCAVSGTVPGRAAEAEKAEGASVTAGRNGHVPFLFQAEVTIQDESVSVGGDSLMTVRDRALNRGDTVQVEGWLSTEAGVARYAYAWAGENGGPAEWHDMDICRISARPDLKQAGVPYPGGYGTAGFSLRFALPYEVPDGYVDLYLRAWDRNGQVMDFLTLSDVRHGFADTDDGVYRTVNLSRLAAGGALTGASVDDGVLTLLPDGRVCLGLMNLARFETLTIHYTAPGRGQAVGENRRAILGLKSWGGDSYGVDGQHYHVTRNLAYAALPVLTGEGTVAVDLTDCAYKGEVFLTGYLSDEPLHIHSVVFTYRNQGFDRTAAKIRFSDSESVMASLGGGNCVKAYGVKDPLCGDVLRMELTDDTNDPFLYFQAEALLDESGISLNADEYAYMVMLSRVHKQDRVPLPTTFYLCSGSIRAPTEACTYTFAQHFDEQWHYYLLDLTDRETWQGRIHGWRFDSFGGNSQAGDYMDVATVQLFRTEEAARAAAGENPADVVPYDRTQAAVLPDDCEETPVPDLDFRIPEEDTYVETEPDRLPDTGDDPSDSTLPDKNPDAEPGTGDGMNGTEKPSANGEKPGPITLNPDDPSDPQFPETGCTSALPMPLSAGLVLIGSAVLLSAVRPASRLFPAGNTAGQGKSSPFAPSRRRKNR